MTIRLLVNHFVKSAIKDAYGSETLGHTPTLLFGVNYPSDTHGPIILLIYTINNVYMSCIL